MKNAANRAVPTATAASSSPIARSVGSPAVVSRPGSGTPINSSARSVDIRDSGTTTAAATTASSTTMGTTLRVRRGLREARASEAGALDDGDMHPS